MQAVTIPIEISRELRPWFQDARLGEAQPSLFHVDLQVTPQKPTQLKSDPRLAQIGYRLMGGDGVLFEGVAPCSWDAVAPAARVALPNPRRVAARAIHLYLAR